MIDKLNLTCDRIPVESYLGPRFGIDERERRKGIYKYFCDMDKGQVLYKPHRWSQETNDRMNYAKIVLNPKNFRGFGEMWAYMEPIFRGAESEIALSMNEFNVTRVDIAADLAGFNMRQILAGVHVHRVRPETFQVYQSTIYAGSDPRYVIYDKVLEIKSRISKGKAITAYEKGLLDAGGQCVRFEVRKKTKGLRLDRLEVSYKEFATFFDRLDLFGQGNEIEGGMMQYLYRSMRRELRAGFEKFRGMDLRSILKSNYLSSAGAWFDCAEPV